MDIYEQIVELRRQGRRGAVATSVGVTRQPESASPDRPAGAPTGGRNPVGGCSSPSTYCPVFISARKIRTRYPVYNTVVLGTKSQVHNILKDLENRKSNWLRDAAKRMARAVEKEWKEYRKS